MRGKKTVLVVEDDFDVTDTLKDVLSDEGYDVVCAENGHKALEYLRSQPPPSLILLDLMMPGMNGLQFRTEQLRQSHLADIPVIVLSAGREADRPRDLPVAGWVKKPFQLSELLEAVKRFC